MRQVIVFAVAVIVSFWGMVVMRENGRQEEPPATEAQSGSESTGDPASVSGPTGTAQPTGTAMTKETISTGDEVDLEAHLTDGVHTVVEFTADW